MMKLRRTTPAAPARPATEQDRQAAIAAVAAEYGVSAEAIRLAMRREQDRHTHPEQVKGSKSAEVAGALAALLTA